MNARAQFVLEASDHPALRRAALALHATEPQDQAWLLAQLPADQRPALERMLADLAALGLPRDRALVQDLLHGKRQPASAVSLPTDSLPTSLDALRSARPMDLFSVLETEPAGLAAHVLALLPRATRGDVLGMMAMPRRRQVQDILGASYTGALADHATRLAPKLTQALVGEIASRLPR
ncbi:MAG TPA: hypothetical protein VLI46_01950, partial [Ramlibacter sp.]|nr:hypothetical protein [Ramlibacter sp.]